MPIPFQQALSRGLLLLEKKGKRALQPYMKRDHFGKFHYYPPEINRSVAAALRNLFLINGYVWPYEELYPGLKHDIPPTPCKGEEKARAAREQRLARIRENMKDMDRKIEECRESRRMKDVSLLDRLTMRSRQIRIKYTRDRQ